MDPDNQTSEPVIRERGAGASAEWADDYPTEGTYQ
jgi:hypothetical protein